MKRYNKYDVTLTKRLYVKLRPWILNHPNHGLYQDGEEQACPNCGGHHLQSRGIYKSKTLEYRRFQCVDCGTWSKSRTAEKPLGKPKKLLAGV